MICNRIYLREGRTDVFLDTFIRGRETINTPRPAVIVMPGGCYQFCGSGEGEPVADCFLSMGYHAFVLHYSVSGREKNPYDTTWPQPFLDAGAAILYIRDHAVEFCIDPDQIAVCGFSAGGHLAAMCAFDWKNPLLSEHFGRDSEQFRVQAAILAYPELIWHPDEEPMAKLIGTNLLGNPDATLDDMAALCPIGFVSQDASPVFLIHNMDDPTVSAKGTMELALALKKAEVPCELHIYDAVAGHGYSLANKCSSVFAVQDVPQVASWPGLVETWLGKYFTITYTEPPWRPDSIIGG